MQTNHLRILCISPRFPPLADSEAFCGGKMILALKNAGADVVVLCEHPSIKGRVDNSSCWAPLFDLCHQIEVPPMWDELTNRRRLQALFYGLIYRNLNRGRHIYNFVLCAKKIHQEKPFNIVYSRSFPIYAHSIGYWCSRFLRLPWIANINDPWDIWEPRIHSDSQKMRAPRPYWYIYMSRYWLHKTLLSANLVTYPSSRLQQFHIHFSGIDHNSDVIPHIGFADESRGSTRSKFLLVHAGKLGAERRSAEPLLNGLARFLYANPYANSVTQMLFIGRDDANINELSCKLGIQYAVQQVGPFDYKESLKYIDSASICVLVETKMNEGVYFPSKLADYLAAGKPVLALSPAQGVVADLAQHGGIRRVNMDDEDAIASAIGDFYQVFIRGDLARLSPPDTLIRMVNPTNVANKLLNSIESICRKSA